jgi:hypothetical protein
MPITRDQQTELRRMLDACTGSGRGWREAARTVPVTAAERAAQRLLKRMEAKRTRARARYTQRFNKLKAEVHETIIFGNDLNKALRLLKQLKAMSL